MSVRAHDRPEYVSPVDTQNCTAVYSVAVMNVDRLGFDLAVYNVPYRNKGCMVDALASRSDEGREMAAIRFGKVPINL